MFINNLDKILLKEGIINYEEREDIIDYSKIKNISFEKALLEKNILKKSDIYGLIEKRYNIEYIDISYYYPDMEIVRQFDIRTLQRSKAFPIKRKANSIIMAMAEPLNVFHIERLKKNTRFKIIPVLSELDKIIEKQSEYFEKHILEDIFTSIAENTVEDDDHISEQVIDAFDLILEKAVLSSASDIHFDPERNMTCIRYRIDGVLKDFTNIPNSIYPNIVSRVKILSNLDIAEKRRPQDGSFESRVFDRELDIRTSFVPTLFGEKLVLRIVSKDIDFLHIDRLGLNIEDEKNIREIINQEQGLILITGPTGSGKSTTLYSIINELNTTEKNIITIEDPVESRLKGVNQIQVNSEIGLGFSSLLRHVLRQDPDIIVVGEIRDYETAKMVISASITGHLVISTIHTEDGPSTISRLIDMGVEKHLVISALKSIISQRLYRENCKYCLIEKKMNENLEKYMNEIFEIEKIQESKGCKRCNYSGYIERKPVLEILDLNNRYKDILTIENSLTDIRRRLEEDGFISLRNKMVSLVKEFKMNPEDYLRYYNFKDH
ncbi:MAG: GspE/PulE family protein [Andreesenia angusta]|nr:GspE/PulE family protein [Andreesenia angusta]